MMTIIWMMLLSGLLRPAEAVAQDKPDNCHVYLVDGEARRQIQEALADDRRLAELAARAVRILGTFEAKVGEGELTMRSFPIAGSDNAVTAAVYYTDESMAAGGNSNSILVGLVVAAEEVRDVFRASGNAVAESSYFDRHFRIRVKQNIEVQGRPFLIGLECECNRR